MPDTAEVTVTYDDVHALLHEMSDLITRRLDALAEHLDRGHDD